MTDFDHSESARLWTAEQEDAARLEAEECPFDQQLTGRTLDPEIAAILAEYEALPMPPYSNTFADVDENDRVIYRTLTDDGSRPATPAEVVERRDTIERRVAAQEAQRALTARRRARRWRGLEVSS